MAVDPAPGVPPSSDRGSARGGAHAPGPAPGLEAVAGELARRERRRALRRGLLVSVWTVVALTLVLELGLRLAGDRERALARGANRTLRRWVELTSSGLFEEIEDDVRRYAMRPGATCTVDGWTFRVSSHRTRGADFPAAKPAGERRLLALGDSFCFGMWSDEDETLAGHLARMANERETARASGLRWRAVNLGVPGYHTGQQLRAFEADGLPLQPDLVVLYYNTNDLERPGFFYDEDLRALRTDHLPLPIPLRRLLWHSHLYGWLTRRYTEALARRPLSHFDPAVPYAWTRPANRRATRAALERLAALCAERGIPLAMVDQPLMTWTGDVRDPEWPGLELVDWAEAARRELGIPGISLLGWMRGYADGVDRFPAPPDEGFLLERFLAEEEVQAYFRGELDGEGFELPEDPDFHLTGEGYRRIAELLYPVLAEQGWVP